MGLHRVKPRYLLHTFGNVDLGRHNDVLNLLDHLTFYLTIIILLVNLNLNQDSDCEHFE